MDGGDDSLLVELQALRLGALKRRAEKHGVDEVTLEAADDADDPKAAMIALLMRLECEIPEGVPDPPVDSVPASAPAEAEPGQPQSEPEPEFGPEPELGPEPEIDPEPERQVPSPAGLPPVSTLSGRDEDVQALTKAVELTGARVLVHGELGAGRRSIMRECASQLTWLQRQWWVSGQTEDAFLLGLAEYGRTTAGFAADSASALVAAKQVLASEQDWLLVVEDVCDASGIVRHIPVGRGRCLFSSESDPAVWRGRAGELLTCATAVRPLPIIDCAQLLCRTALQLDNGSPVDAAAMSVLESSDAGRAVQNVIESGVGCLPVGVKMLGTLMQGWCAADISKDHESQALRLTRGLEEIAKRHDMATAESAGALPSPRGALVPEPKGAVAGRSGATKGAARAVSTRGRCPITPPMLDIAEDLIDEKKESEEAALGAHALLRCLAVLGDAAARGVPEQFWSDTKLNASALRADKQARARESAAVIDATGDVSTQFKAYKPVRNQAELLWVDGTGVHQCMRCLKSFTMRIRKHHCRRCGKVICETCSTNSQSLPKRGYIIPVRVCDGCYEPPVSLSFEDDDHQAPTEGSANSRKASKERRLSAACGTRLFTDLSHYESAVQLLQACGLVEVHRRRKDDKESPPYITLHRCVQLALLTPRPTTAVTPARRRAIDAAMVTLWTVLKWRFVEEQKAARRIAALHTDSALLVDDTQALPEGITRDSRSLYSPAAGLLRGCVSTRASVLPVPLVSCLAVSLAEFLEQDLSADGYRLAEQLFRIAATEQLPDTAFVPGAIISADISKASPAAADSQHDVTTVQRHSLRVAGYKLALARNLLSQAQPETRAEEAAELILRTVAVRKKWFNIAHEDTLQAMSLHVDALRAYRPPRHEDASKVLQELYQATEGVLGPLHPNTASALLQLASCASSSNWLPICACSSA